jgi:hypothetical protein
MGAVIPPMSGSPPDERSCYLDNDAPQRLEESAPKPRSGQNHHAAAGVEGSRIPPPWR